MGFLFSTLAEIKNITLNQKKVQSNKVHTRKKELIFLVFISKLSVLTLGNKRFNYVFFNVLKLFSFMIASLQLFTSNECESTHHQHVCQVASGNQGRPQMCLSKNITRHLTKLNPTTTKKENHTFIELYTNTSNKIIK